MILIADSGSTKTHWVALNEAREVAGEQITSGINPFLLSVEEVQHLLKKEVEIPEEKISVLYFYGAGCTPEKQESMQILLKRFFQAETVEVHSDLLGAARSLCQDEKGIVGILGTGSNSCYYDGKKIAQQTSSLGFILGDEGSGSYLGKRLISDLLKSQLPREIADAFQEKYRLDQSQVLERVYRLPFPNRFLAGFAVFLRENIHYPEIRKLVSEGFQQFIQRNLLQYPDVKKLPVHLTGSIAWGFREILEEVLKEEQLSLGRIRQKPMDGLIEYHSSR
jgi:Predicted N-acetylglucosamine kinase